VLSFSPYLNVEMQKNKYGQKNIKKEGLNMSNIKEQVLIVREKIKEHNESFAKIKADIEAEHNNLQKILRELQSKCKHNNSTLTDHYHDTVIVNGYQEKITFYNYECNDCGVCYDTTKEPDVDEEN
jgi:hypothetical protein